MGCVVFFFLLKPLSLSGIIESRSFLKTGILSVVRYWIPSSLNGVTYKRHLVNICQINKKMKFLQVKGKKKTDILHAYNRPNLVLGI